MKITVEISDELMEEARQVAWREKTSFKALVEEGLRRVLAERGQGSEFKLRRASFRGDGLQPQVRIASGEGVQGMIYEKVKIEV